LLIGGMGGFGRAIATWVAEKGAKNLAFISRSGDSTPAAKQLV
jgi:shikimate 5-dehydrogenase